MLYLITTKQLDKWNYNDQNYNDNNNDINIIIINLLNFIILVILLIAISITNSIFIFYIIISEYILYYIWKIHEMFKFSMNKY